VGSGPIGCQKVAIPPTIVFAIDPNENPMTTRSVLLDFGNVIAFFDHHKACRQLAGLSRRGLDAQHIYHIIFETGLETGYDTGRLSTPDFIGRLRQTFDLRGDDREIAHAWSDIFSPNEPMAAAMRELKSRGLRLVLASNTNELHHEQFAREFADVLAPLDAEILSYRVGSRKPEHAFYAACIEAAGCPPGECLYVDDRADFISAGRELGLPGVVYTPTVDVLGALCY
jgi:glucose-1-phosphatase